VSEIVLSDVSKTFPGGIKAVDEISLTIQDGELMVLVGPSGCGKTTLLRMIAGLETVDDGTIRLGDRDITNLEPRDRDIAMVFQDYALHPHMNVRRKPQLRPARQEDSETRDRAPRRGGGRAARTERRSRDARARDRLPGGIGARQLVREGARPSARGLHSDPARARAGRRTRLPREPHPRLAAEYVPRPLPPFAHLSLRAVVDHRMPSLR
jgi:ABC-type Fe3+/spermidine/putrescine transport system ATPase subunit